MRAEDQIHDNTIYVQTSGSTGSAKSIARSSLSWQLSAKAEAEVFGIGERERFAVMGSPSHSLWAYVAYRAEQANGAFLGVAFGQGSAKRMANELLAFSPSVLYAVPELLASLLQGQAPRLDRLRLLLLGGGAWTPELMGRVQAFAPNAETRLFYGSAEASFIAHSSPSDWPWYRPFPGVQIRVNADTKQLSVCSPFTASPGEDRWFATTDCVEVEQAPAGAADGDRATGRRIRLTGRMERLIRFNGVDIAPEPIEAFISQHCPGVLLAVCLLGERSRLGLLYCSDTGRGALWRPDRPSIDLPRIRGLVQDEFPGLPVLSTSREIQVWPRLANGKTDFRRLNEIARDTSAIDPVETDNSDPNAAPTRTARSAATSTPGPSLEPVYILAAGRTSIAPAHGALAALGLHDLVAANWEALLEATRAAAPAFSEHAIEGFLMGNGLAAGGNPARLCLLAAGFDSSLHGLTVDTQCCSGLDAVGLAAMRIAAGGYACLLAGGAESASNAPARARRLQDGRLSFFSEAQFAPDPTASMAQPTMSQAARELARGMELHSLYDYAINSHARVLKSEHPDRFAAFGRDSHPRAMRMALCQRGEANAIHNPATMAPLADGSCLLILANQRRVLEWNARPLAQVLSHQTVGADPLQPALAVHQLLPWLGGCLETWLDKAEPMAQMPIAVELMESFSAQAILNRRALLEWADEYLGEQGAEQLLEINPHGGLLALGHPIGASGAVLLARLAHRLVPGQLGVAIIPAAGGLASAMLLKGVGRPGPR